MMKCRAIFCRTFCEGTCCPARYLLNCWRLTSRLRQRLATELHDSTSSTRFFCRLSRSCGRSIYENIRGSRRSTSAHRARSLAPNSSDGSIDRNSLTRLCHCGKTVVRTDDIGIRAALPVAIHAMGTRAPACAELRSAASIKRMPCTPSSTVVNSALDAGIGRLSSIASICKAASRYSCAKASK
jgi:hypothetical protein